MKQKPDPRKWLEPNDASNPPHSSDSPRNSEPSDHPQNPEPDPSNQPDKYPKKLLDIVRQAGIDVKGTETRSREKGEGSKGRGARGKGQGVKGKVPGAGGRVKRAGSASPLDGVPSVPMASQSLPSDELPSEKYCPATKANADALPTLPDSIFPTLPGILQKVVAVAGSKEERDVMLLGSLVACGACLSNFHGYYDGMKVFPHLYLFITARASAGKGRLSLCKQLVMPIHLQLREESQRLKEQYDLDMQKYNKKKGKPSAIKKPVKPPELMLIIPANNSATGMFQLLAENGGRGLFFETEGDTLSQAARNDHGISDGFRKGSQHETISYYRRTDRQFAEILNACIAAVLSGTPNQVASLIPSAENGLLSRFIFYHMNIRPVWKDVFAANRHKKLQVYFDQLGQEFLPLYKGLNEHPEIEFCLTEDQQDQFNAFFDQIQEEYLTLQGIDYTATVRRLGLIAFRMAMTFSALRILETGDYSTPLVCSEVDFQATISMIQVLVKHSSHVFSELQKNAKTTRVENKSERLLNNLPFKFSHQDLMEVAKNLAIPKRTAEMHISNFCNKGLIVREKKGEYTNLTLLKNFGNGENDQD